MNKVKLIKLNNGVTIPQIGYGVYQISKEITKQCVLAAFDAGYRHIDTAFAYSNEKEVGEALKESKLKRKEVFITTKVYGARDYQDAVNKIELSLKTLDIDYIDMMLIHWPEGDNIALYKAMEEYYRKGKLRAIGLSNFYGEELNKILNICEVMPVVNQIEAHIFRNQKTMQELLMEHNIVLEAWSPLAAGTNNIFNNETLVSIGKKYSKSAAQVALRYLYQKDIIIIPRSKNSERIRENISIIDFELSEDDMKLIDTLDKNKSIYDK